MDIKERDELETIAQKNKEKKTNTNRRKASGIM
jgi:hypothetical protein